MYLSRLSSTAALAALLAAWAFSKDAAADQPAFSDQVAFETLADAQGGFASQNYHSSRVRGPIFQVNAWDSSRADDSPYIFIGSVYGEGNAGPMILNARDLSLVYADQRYANTYHSDVQFIKGRPYYFFWEGAHSRGHANGNCLFFDENYKLRYNLTAQNRPGTLADMHDVRVTHDGNVLFSTYFNVPWDTTALGGEVDSLIMDSGFQEVDVETNEVLFDWAASDHFQITDSFAPYTKGYGVGPNSGFDFAHINSVEKTVDGDYLISMRHLSVVALISGQDGSPIWTLGGKTNQFQDLDGGRATDFSWQHDARFHFGNTSQITMFDNHGELTDHCPSEESPTCHTRGLHLELDYQAKTAGILQEYWHPNGVNSGAMGGLTTLKNGNVFMGWGYNPSYTEFAPDGTTVLSFNRGAVPKQLADMFAYRVTKGDWVGRPHWAPSMAVRRAGDNTDNATLHVSWNGATEVVTWAICASDDRSRVLKPSNIIGYFNRVGFETTAELGPSTHAPRRYLVTAALDAQGRILGATDVMDMSDGTWLDLGIAFTINTMYQFTPKGGVSLETVGLILLLAVAAYYGALAWKKRKAMLDVEQGYKPMKFG